MWLTGNVYTHQETQTEGFILGGGRRYFRSPMKKTIWTLSCLVFEIIKSRSQVFLYLAYVRSAQQKKKKNHKEKHSQMSILHFKLEEEFVISAILKMWLVVEICVYSQGGSGCQCCYFSLRTSFIGWEQAH